MLSKNKTTMVALEKRYSDWESRQEKLDSLSKFAIAKSKNPKLERSIFFSEEQKPMDVLNALNNRYKNGSPKKKKKKKNVSTKPMVSPSPKSKRRSKRTKPVGPVIITCKDNIQHELPLPGKYDDVYTVRETIIHLAPFRGKGIKRIVKELYKEGRVDFSPTTFFRHFDKYVANSSALPDENYFGSTRGRKTGFVVEKVPKTMNAKEHANVSHVGDGLQDSRVALIESRKRTLEANGMCFDSDSLEPSKSTIAIYNKMATFLIQTCLLSMPILQGRRQSCGR
jgi:hypothetical protein